MSRDLGQLRVSSRIVVCALLFSASAAPIEAEDSFPLRLLTGVASSPTYPAQAARGDATAASNLPASFNPASLDFFRGEPLQFHAMPAAIPVFGFFGNGTCLTGANLSLDTRGEERGTLRLGPTMARSNEEELRTGESFQFQTVSLGVTGSIAYGEAPRRNAYGFTLAYDRVDTELGTMHPFLGPLDVQSATEGVRFRLGTIQQLNESWRAGAVLNGGYFASETDIELPAGSLLLQSSGDDIRNLGGRLGLAYNPTEAFDIEFDYDFQHYAGDDDSLERHRFILGTTIRPMRELALHGGVEIDDEGESGVSTGLSVYPLESMSLDVSVQHGTLGTLEPEFGEATMVLLSASIQF